MVVPHLTENYGASRDPPEKSAPMCTLHSFPHNIDHCLTWARSEFEGLFEKSPAEANAYLAKPDEYAAAARSAGDAAARENLEKAAECLLTSRCATYEDCIAWARTRFQEAFYDKIAQLTFTFPRRRGNVHGQPLLVRPQTLPTCGELRLLRRRTPGADACDGEPQGGGARFGATLVGV